MKARMHFDTLTYANKLKAAGMEPKLAEAQALALVEAIDEGVATRADISEVKAEISQVKTELKQVKAELKADISQVRAELKAEIFEVKSGLIQWMVGLFIANVTL